MSVEELPDTTTTTTTTPEESPAYQWDSAAQKEVKQQRARIQKLDANIIKYEEKIKALKEEMLNADQMALDKVDDLEIREEQAKKSKKKISRKMEKLFVAQTDVREYASLEKKVAHNSDFISELRATNKTLKKEHKKTMKVYDEYLAKNDALMDTTSNLHNSFANMDELAETENERHRSLREDLAEEKAQESALLEEVKTMEKHYNVVMLQRVECQTFMAQITEDIKAEMTSRKLANAIIQIAINVQEDAEERMEKLKEKYGDDTDDLEEKKS